MPRFSKSELIFPIGSEIYVSDLSGAHIKGEGVSLIRDLHYEIDNEYSEDNPLIVKSLPYIPSCNCGWMNGEYFIDVKLKKGTTIYSVLNSSNRVFRNYHNYVGFVMDCDACSWYGY